MNSHTAQMKTRIEAETGVRIADVRPFCRGFQSRLYVIDLKDGRRLIAKTAPDRSRATLDTEGWMLDYLRYNTDLPVPRVLYADPGCMVMAYVQEGGGLAGAAMQEAADHLARLHDINGTDYGLDRDTVIGTLAQPNAPSNDWIAFFRENRLMHSARAAYAEQRIDMALLRRIERLAGKLGELIGLPEGPPSLIHGDVWAGNILALDGRIAAFIDPALYFADAEIELAFISLFRTFDSVLFDRYSEHRPIRPGFFSVRKDIYNLYPLLVHTRLFGGDYVPTIERILDRFV